MAQTRVRAGSPQWPYWLYWYGLAARSVVRAGNAPGMGWQPTAASTVQTGARAGSPQRLQWNKQRRKLAPEAALLAGTVVRAGSPQWLYCSALAARSGFNGTNMGRAGSLYKQGFGLGSPQSLSGNGLTAHSGASRGAGWQPLVGA